jgi:tRNA(Ile)-lysidine synthase
MPSTPPSPAAETAFLTALTAGLPATHDWVFPSLVAVSGGADSVALATAIARLAPAGARGQLVIAHADHGLRAESAADRDFVRALAERLGVRFVGRRLDVAAAVGREGLEGRARRLRYDFLAEAAHEAGARHVMVAHTADDQAETILHRLLRGTGVAGLAGMRRARRLADGVALIRPLLHVSRASARAFLAATGQGWREDATNADPARARNFLRHEILPRCTAGPYPAAAEAIVRLGDQAAAASAALASAAEHLLDARSRRLEGGGVAVRTTELAGLDHHLLAEMCAAIWRREDWPRGDMTAGHYRAIAALVRAGDEARPLELPGGILARRQAGELMLEPRATRPSRPACSRRSPRNTAESPGRSPPSSPG